MTCDSHSTNSLNPFRMFSAFRDSSLAAISLIFVSLENCRNKDVARYSSKMGLFEGLLLVYFATHIPITIVLDSQVVFDQDFYPSFARDLFEYYINNYPDFLFKNCRTQYPYVRWIGACEVFLQLPFFFVAIYALYRRKEWIRIPGIVYCSHVATTVIPAVADFLQNPEGDMQVLFLCPHTSLQPSSTRLPADSSCAPSMGSTF